MQVSCLLDVGSKKEKPTKKAPTKSQKKKKRNLDGKKRSCGRESGRDDFWSGKTGIPSKDDLVAYFDQNHQKNLR